MVAGTAAIEVARTSGLVEHAAGRGTRLLADLRSALAGNPLIGDVRGRGLMIGIETTSTDVARAIRAAALVPGSTWDRLVALKGRYDPGNLFRLSQNIPPPKP